jgi:flagellar biosynthesis GTPase FlhF
MSAKYNFDKNLLKLSRAKTIEDAKEEWYVIDESILATQSAICICSRKIKKVTYLYNRFTKKTIVAGSRCCKKFNMLTQSLGKNMYTAILREFLKKGEYVIIDDIIEYSANVKSILIKRCEYRIESYKDSSNIFNLSELRDEIIQLETIYGITYLNHLLVLIDTYIKVIRKKNEEEVKRMKELREAREREEAQARKEAEAREREEAQAREAREREEAQARKEAEAREREEAQAREEAKKATEAQERIRAEAREKIKRETEEKERKRDEATEREKRELCEKLAEKQRIQLEREEEKRVANEKKRKEREEKIALLPTLTCINCSKEFKDSPCRSTSSCSLRCELAKYP